MKKLCSKIVLLIGVGVLAASLQATPQGSILKRAAHRIAIETGVYQWPAAFNLMGQMLGLSNSLIPMPVGAVHQPTDSISNHAAFVITLDPEADGIPSQYKLPKKYKPGVKAATLSLPRDREITKEELDKLVLDAVNEQRDKSGIGRVTGLDMGVIRAMSKKVGFHQGIPAGDNKKISAAEEKINTLLKKWAV